MLPKQHRLTKDKDFERVFKNGRSFFVREFGIKSVKNDLQTTRIGIVLPKKTFKTIQRNRIKRQIRHVFVENIKKIKPSFDIMFIARKDIVNYKTFAEMREGIERVLKRIRLLS